MGIEHRINKKRAYQLRARKAAEEEAEFVLLQRNYSKENDLSGDEIKDHTHSERDINYLGDNLIFAYTDGDLTKITYRENGVSIVKVIDLTWDAGLVVKVTKTYFDGEVETIDLLYDENGNVIEVNRY